MRPNQTQFKTNGFNPYSVEFSPFMPNRIAIASAANFGIVGNGRLWVLRNNNLEQLYNTQDALFDVAWAENHENQLVTSGGDGVIKLWDLTLPDFPVRNFTEHTKEVFSVNWNLVAKDVFVTGSWDLTIKIWNPELPQSIQTFQEHTHCIYQTSWSPHAAQVFASCSGDQTLKLWDVRQPQSVQTIHAHNNEVLCLDWNKYQRDQIVTGSVDTTMRVWDLRMPQKPINELRGHQYAVRRLKCSPHSGNIVGSVSYDMTMRLWDITKGQQVYQHDGHTEFVLGIDFSLFVPDLIATCGWDEMVFVLSLK